jgi:hypothetical protein
MRNVSDRSSIEGQNILFSVNPHPPKIVRFVDNVEKYIGAGEATDENMAYVHFMLGT